MYSKVRLFGYYPHNPIIRTYFPSKDSIIQLYYPAVQGHCTYLDRSMHGRVKVRSSEEQVAAKRLEREKKIKKYQTLSEEIYARREAGKLDEELLRLTEELLGQNPDHYTMWNTRRDAMKQIIAECDVETKAELFKRELHFLEKCLRTNPKSYGTYVQRRWVMSESPLPDWKQEIDLCNLFLFYDERNFHCWDYRRFVVERSDITPMQELEFSLKKIEDNLSNYSAWHYRSQLLPLCFPADSPGASADSSSVREERLLEEFDLVTIAVFTDPGDQSSWFYQQWLLGRARKQERLLYFIHFTSNQVLLLVFNQPVVKELLKEVQVMRSEDVLDLEWIAHGVPPGWPSCVWSAVPTCPDTPLGLECRFRKCLLSLAPASVFAAAADLEEIGPADSLTAAKSSVLSSHCESVRELLRLEPDNKWCQLTALQLHWAIDPDSNAGAIAAHFSALQKQDPSRRAYYQDLRSKFLLETGVSAFLKKRDFSALSLTGMGLTRLYHTHFFSTVSRVDLSNNRLTDMNGLALLVTCRELNLDGNLLTEVEEDILCLMQLKLLSLKDNLIEGESSLLLLQKLSALERVSIGGNPLLKDRDPSQLIKAFSKISLNCESAS